MTDQEVHEQTATQVREPAITRSAREAREEIWRMERDTLDETLRDLWSRRPTLTKVEWDTLYLIVVRVLRRGYVEVLSSLPEKRDWYIQNYFIDRVLRFENPGEIYHAGALLHFFRNYLFDQIDALHALPLVPGHPPNDPHPAGDMPAFGNAGLPGTAIESRHDGDEDSAARDSRKLIDQIVTLAGEALAGSLDATRAAGLEDIERYLGVSLPRVIASARRFLKGDGEWSALRDDGWWIGIYLREHHCPERGEALYRLAQRHAIPSHHHKALRLGVTVPKDDARALAAFASSLRGQWLRSLNIPVDAWHVLEIMLALKILCLVALSEQGGG